MKSQTRRLFWITLFLLLMGALAAPKLWPPSQATIAASSSAPEQEAAVLVEVEPLQPERLGERLATTGTIRAAEQIELVSEIAGKVENILFTEGRPVAEGQLLVKLDDDELQASRERAQHRVELAERRERRQQQLVDEGVVSQQEYDFVRNELDVLRAELRLIEVQLRRTEIRAPFSGTIGLRYISSGSYLSPQTRIASLQATGTVKIDFSVPEKYASAIALGDEIMFRVKAAADTVFRGEIYAIEPGVDRETRSLMLRARSSNDQGFLRPGAFADIDLLVGEIAEALMVPAIAVIPDLGGKKVFVYEDGFAQPRPVETGIRTDSGVQILRGLAPGDLVITSGIQRLRAGIAVELAPRS